MCNTYHVCLFQIWICIKAQLYYDFLISWGFLYIKSTVCIHCNELQQVSADLKRLNLCKLFVSRCQSFLSPPHVTVFGFGKWPLQFQALHPGRRSHAPQYLEGLDNILRAPMEQAAGKVVSGYVFFSYETTCHFVLNRAKKWQNLHK